MRIPVVAKPFDQAWTLEDTRHLLQVHEASPGSDQTAAFQAWLKGDWAKITDQLQAATAGHMAHLASEGKLGMPANAEHIQVNWLYYWKQLIEKPEDQEAAQSLGNLMRGVFIKPLYYLRDPKTAEQVHQAITDKVVQGNFGYYDMEPGECFNTGETIRLVMDNWQPTLGSVAFTEDHKSSFTPFAPGQLTPPKLEHVVIPVPSGELLINDWFRVPGFTEMTDAIARDNGNPDIGSTQGRADLSRIYAEKAGFVSVFVGGSFPHVIKRDGRLLVGCVDIEGEIVVPGKDLGRVDTNLRWATMIDRQVLVDFLATATSPAEAEAAVATMEKESRQELIKVKLPPGEYHLYFAGREDVFEKEFKSNQVDMSAFERPMIVLSPDALDLKPVASKAPRRAGR